MFLPGVKNIFASRTQILCPKHMFPSLATTGNITRNIVSATMFHSLARVPLKGNLPKEDFDKWFNLAVAILNAPTRGERK